MSTFVTIVFVLIVIGVVLYLINTRVPMDSTIKLIINIVIVLGIVAWLLNMTGLLKWK
jgi:hypothetical protein